MRTIKRYLKNIWNWHLKNNADAYSKMYGKFSYKV